MCMTRARKVAPPHNGREKGPVWWTEEGSGRVTFMCPKGHRFL